MKKRSVFGPIAPELRWSLLASVAISSALVTGSSNADDCAGQECSPAYSYGAVPTIQPTNGVFKFQARITKAKLPVGKGEFNTVVVNVLNGSEVVCSETLSKVAVNDSVLNLEIGRKMDDCDLRSKIAAQSDLSFQVCIDGSENCLAPISLSTVPYSVKSDYAVTAQNAHQAQIAAQSHYTHRATADRNTLVSGQIGIGYYDFHSPTDAQLGNLAGGASASTGEAFLQWTPGLGGVKKLNLASKNDIDESLYPLDEFSIHALQTNANGNLAVTGNAAVTGNETVGGTLGVTGATTLGSTLTVAGVSTLNNTLEVALGQSSNLRGPLTVYGATTPTSLQGTLGVTGASNLSSTLTVGGVTQLNDTFNVATGKASNLGGALTVNGVTWLNDTFNVATGKASNLGGTLTVTGVTTLNDTFNVATGKASNLGGTLTVAGRTDVNGQLYANNGLEVVLNKASNLRGPLTVYGATTPTVLEGTLAVNGASTLNGALTVVGVTNANGQLYANNGLEVALNKASNLRGPVTVYGAATPTVLEGTLAVNGASTLNGALTVVGVTNANGQLYANNGLEVALNKASNLRGPLTVYGAATPTVLQGTLGVTGASTLGGTLNVGGATTLNGPATLNGDVAIGSAVSPKNLIVYGTVGATTYSGDVAVGTAQAPKNLTVYGTTTFAGTVNLPTSVGVNTMSVGTGGLQVTDGSVSVSGGGLHVEGGSTMVEDLSAVNISTNQLTSNGAIFGNSVNVNSGGLAVSGGGVNVVTGPLNDIVLSTRNAQIGSTGSIVLSAPAGSVQIAGGTGVSLSGAVGIGGSLVVNGSSTLNAASVGSGGLSSTGPVNFTKGVVVTGGDILLDGSMTNNSFAVNASNLFFGANAGGVFKAQAENVLMGHGGNAVGAGVRRAVVLGGGPTNDDRFAANTIDRNYASADYASIGGGAKNTVSAAFGTVDGGQNNTASGQYASVGGGWMNIASGSYSAVGGGGSNMATAQLSTVSGGYQNSTQGDYSVVAGGQTNAILTGSSNATISGGWQNTINGTGTYATIAGGSSNNATADRAVISGGAANIATGKYSVVAGGTNNAASADYAFVGGGFQNSVSGVGAFAAGQYAKANSAGCFIWADQSTTSPLYCGGPTANSTGPNRFLVRAAGGVYLYTNAAMTMGASLGAGATAFAPLSDRTTKHSIVEVDAEDVLTKLDRIPVATWHYNEEVSQAKHMGPMAQDFHAAFGLGDDNRHISTIDADGVALAGVKGVHSLVKKQAAKIEAQASKIDALTKELETVKKSTLTSEAHGRDVEERLARLEAGGGAGSGFLRFSIFDGSTIGTLVAAGVAFALGRRRKAS